jgi:hypothetical protein
VGPPSRRVTFCTILPPLLTWRLLLASASTSSKSLTASLFPCHLSTHPHSMCLSPPSHLHLSVVHHSLVPLRSMLLLPVSCPYPVAFLIRCHNSRLFTVTPIIPSSMSAIGVPACSSPTKHHPKEDCSADLGGTIRRPPHLKRQS